MHAKKVKKIVITAICAGVLMLTACGNSGAADQTADSSSAPVVSTQDADGVVVSGAENAEEESVPSETSDDDVIEPEVIAPQAIDDSEAQSAPTPTDGVVDVGDTIVVTASVANVRSTPDASSPANIIGGLQNGEVRTVLGIENGWYQIEYNNGTLGYISGNIAALAQDAASSEAETTESEPEEDSVEEEVSRPEESEDAEGTLKTVSALIANVRGTADRNSAIIGALYKGETFTVAAESGEWYEFVYEGQTGYILIELCE